MPRRRPEFESGEAGAEAAKLKKFSDAGGSQSLRLSDVGRTDFRITSGRRQTPDERFLVNLYLAAQKKGDLSASIDSREIARAVGLKETALKNIVKHLAQANFVKKVDAAALQITERGCAFARDALASS